jgi:Fe-S cluster assembly protein SufD
VLDGASRGVWTGRIFVAPDAQKTSAVQTNRNLLLSDGAHVDTRPQLEIYADDVKCSHGAAVGRLDADALFYLRARGIGVDEARALLTYAFVNEVLTEIPDAVVRRGLERALAAGQFAGAGPGWEAVG